MRYTIFDTPIVNSLLRWQAVFLLKIFGWRKEGGLPEARKFVVIAAPHTSNWELPIALILAFAFRVKVRWMGKDSLFRGPLRPFFKWLGGIPVNRAQSSGMVAQSIQAFRDNEQMVMVLAPEGTRRSSGNWRSGFYHIARGSNVPIVLGFLDFRRKVGGIGPVIVPTGDLNADMKTISAFYADITPRHPERAKPVTIAAGV